MMMNEIAVFLTSGVVVPAASDDGDGAFFFWLLGPAAGIGYYSMMYLRYRNSDKRHQYERETHAVLADLKTYDQRVSNVKGVRNPQINGSNSNTPLQRLGRGTSVTTLDVSAPNLPDILSGQTNQVNETPGPPPMTPPPPMAPPMRPAAPMHPPLPPTS